jgi:polysaccharide deacetylase family protein (PEP-CTERM system associated)
MSAAAAARRTQPRLRKTHLLSIALEDYFHGPAFSKLISKRRWSHFESRFEQNCLTVLEQLRAADSTATFFVNAWIARSRPDLLKEVSRNGHEIALAGQRGVSFRKLSAEALHEQSMRDRDILENACGRRVLGFRVTDVLLRPADMWALETLSKDGFAYDSSVSPFLRAFAKEPWRRFIHKNSFASGSFWEVPLASHSFGGLMFPFAGGNYFRQYPEWFVKRLLQSWDENLAEPLVLYFRLWDFDLQQPRLQTGSPLAELRHYRNAERMVRTLGRLFEQFRFSAIAQHLELPCGVLPRKPLDAVRQPAVTLCVEKEPAKPVSIIIPCFNEQEGIPFLFNNLTSLREELRPEYDAEFIVVDDASSDGTWALLNQYFKNSAAKLVRHSKNQGVSAAIMTGLSQAREIACSIDCDCSYDPSELKPMLRLMRDGVDLVTASPYHPNGSVVNVPRWRLALSRCSSALYRAVTGCNLHTFTACFRVYRRSAVIGMPLKNGGFLGVAELLGRLALEGRQIEEHPAVLEVRIFGQSKMKVLRTIGGHLRLLNEIAWVRFRDRKAAKIPASSSFPV